MNNTVLKNVAFAASGALFGALGGYLVSYKVLSEKFEKELEEYKESDRREVVLIRDELKELGEQILVYQQAGLSFETAKAIAEKNKEAQRAKDRKLMEQEKSDKKETLNVHHTQFVNYVEKTKKEQDVIKDPELEKDELETNVENFTPSEPVKEEAPYLISVDQFANDRDDFRKVSCTYYIEDNVICETAHNEKISGRHVGQENLDMLINSDIDIMYVRNEYLEIDYEIDKYEGSYSYEVLGEESLNE